MKNIFLAGFLLILLTLSSQAETREYYNSGELRFVFPTKINGKLNGVVREYYRNGNVKYLWHYKNGKKNGIAKKYEHGTLKYTWFYKNGKRSITTKEYNRNGTLKRKFKHFNMQSKAKRIHHKRKYKKELRWYCVQR